GANSGIGKATALGLAKRGGRVLMICRDWVKGQNARDEIVEQSWNQDVHVLKADLALQTDIRKLARRLHTEQPRIDILVHNAGAYFHDRLETREGLEKTWAINVMAPFLLTHLLRDMLSRSEDARVINIGSIGERFGSLDFEDLQARRGYQANSAYNASKLALTMLTYEQARRYADQGIKVNVVNPGGVKTHLVRQARRLPLHLRIAYSLAQPFLLTPKEGADTPIFLATEESLAESTGQYYHRRKAKTSSAASHDRKAAARLWQACEELVIPVAASGTVSAS
ncbi:MAG: SDR family oxidoreductase, partial [Bacteroidetes bacterium]